MKKLLSIIALSVIALGLPMVTRAEDKPAAASPAPAAKAMPFHASVTTIDTAGKSFTHKNKDGKDVKFNITDKTTFKSGKWEDVKVGDNVAGLRTKKSDTEYDVTEVTQINAAKAPAK